MTSSGTPTGQKLKSLKLLRVLRPLKTINRVPKLKAVFDCVVISLKNVFNILIVYILFQVFVQCLYRSICVCFKYGDGCFSSSLPWWESSCSTASSTSARTSASTRRKIASKMNLCCSMVLLRNFFFRGEYFEFSEEDGPPEVMPRVWDRKPFHYDNCFMAMLTLFAVQTSEGWVA